MYQTNFLILLLTIGFSSATFSKCKVINRHYSESLCTTCSCSAAYPKAGRDTFTLGRPKDEEPCYWSIIKYGNVTVIQNAKYGGNIFASDDDFNANFVSRRVFGRTVKGNMNDQCYWIVEPVIDQPEYSTIKNLGHDEYLFVTDTVGAFGRRFAYTRIGDDYSPDEDTKAHWILRCT